MNANEITKLYKAKEIRRRVDKELAKELLFMQMQKEGNLMADQILNNLKDKLQFPVTFFLKTRDSQNFNGTENIIIFDIVEKKLQELGFDCILFGPYLMINLFQNNCHETTLEKKKPVETSNILPKVNAKKSSPQLPPSPPPPSYSEATKNQIRKSRSACEIL